MIDETPTPAVWSAREWSQVELPDEMQEALLDACEGDEYEAQAYAAYLCEFPSALDTDREYTAEEARAVADEAKALLYDYWDDIADEWFHDHGGEETMAMLYDVADDNEDAILKQLTTALGRQLAEADGMHWFFETGLLSTGAVYCFKRPE